MSGSNRALTFQIGVDSSTGIVGQWPFIDAGVARLTGKTMPAACVRMAGGSGRHSRERPGAGLLALCDPSSGGTPTLSLAGRPANRQLCGTSPVSGSRRRFPPQGQLKSPGASVDSAGERGGLLTDSAYRWQGRLLSETRCRRCCQPAVAATSAAPVTVPATMRRAPQRGAPQRDGRFVPRAGRGSDRSRADPIQIVRARSSGPAGT